MIKLWGSLAGAATLAGVLTFTHVQAYQAGAASERAAILTRSVDVLRDRRDIEDEARNLDDAGLCVAIGGRWLPDERRCE